MDHEFITIGEATRLLKATDIAIMRMIKEALQAGFEKDEIMKKELRGDRMMFLVSKQFLLGELEQEKEPRKDEESFEQEEEKLPPEESVEQIGTKDEMISVLQKIIDTKDRQLDDLSRKIDQLIERDHETNILLKGLQDRLFMLESGEGRQENARNSKKQGS